MGLKVALAKVVGELEGCLAVWGEVAGVGHTPPVNSY